MSDRMTGSSRVPEAKILDRVMVVAGSLVGVSSGTSYGSGGPVQESFSGVLKVPR